MSKRKAKIIWSEDGTTFDFTAERLREVETDKTWSRAVTRKQVREALQYSRTHIDAHFPRTRSTERTVYKDCWLIGLSAVSFSIGCKIFYGANFEAISKWAWAKPRRKKAAR